MKTAIVPVLMMASFAAVADSLPVFSIQPTNMTVSPGSTATLVASATGATSYQWRFMGLDISGATGSVLQIPSTQTSNSGYYNVIAKNLTGWVPSQLAYLSLDYTYGGTDTNSVGWVPFSNVGGHQALYDVYTPSGFWQTPINTGSVQVVAGPRLDQLVRIGVPIKYKKTTTGSYLNNGYYDYAPGVPVPSPANEMVPTATGGQTIYYGVLFTYTNSGYVYTQPSTIISVVAGGNGNPVPSVSNLKFPIWEWPEPVAYDATTNRTFVRGETFSLTNKFLGYTDYGVPTFQWRKDGIPIGNPQPFEVQQVVSATATAVLTITNAAAGDTGVYDVQVLGNYWFVGQKTRVSIQTTGGQGTFSHPQFLGSNFVCQFDGAPGRNYRVQQSTNHANWSDLVTLSNVTGTVMFTNSPGSVGAHFYRTVLMP